MEYFLQLRYLYFNGKESEMMDTISVVVYLYLCVLFLKIILVNLSVYIVLWNATQGVNFLLESYEFWKTVNLLDILFIQKGTFDRCTRRNLIMNLTGH